MENIIKKAIEGGYKSEHRQDWENLKECCKDCSAYKTFEQYMFSALKNSKNIFFVMVLDPLFWQALSKTFNWKNKSYDSWAFDSYWLQCAVKFHTINLEEGWDKAVAYLSSLIK